MNIGALSMARQYGRMPVLSYEVTSGTFFALKLARIAASSSADRMYRRGSTKKALLVSIKKAPDRSTTREIPLVPSDVYPAGLSILR